MKKIYIVIGIIAIALMFAGTCFLVLQQLTEKNNDSKKFDEKIDPPKPKDENNTSLPPQVKNKDKPKFVNGNIKLPEPRYTSNVSVEQTLLKRRSIREYKNEALTIAEVSQLLWAAQGITDTKRGFRTAPSAGALYPLEVYVVVGNVEDIPKGVYKYNPHTHELIKVKEGDARSKLGVAALGQPWVEEGAIVIVFSAVYERTTRKYGDRGIRYVHIEVGHAAQNVCLQAVALNLGTVVVGAFKDEDVKKIMNMPDEEHPLYIIPVGRI